MQVLPARGQSATVLLALLLAVPGLLSAQPGPRVTLNLVMTDAESGEPESTAWMDSLDCGELSSGSLSGSRYAWLVLSDPDGFTTGFSAVQFGVAHDLDALEFLPYNANGELVTIAEPGWPGSGTGIAIAYTGPCVPHDTPSIRLGRFAIPAGVEGTLSIIADPRVGAAKLADCNSATNTLCEVHLGSIDVTAGGEPVCASHVPDAPTAVSVSTGLCPVEVTWVHPGDGVGEFHVWRNNGGLVGVVGPEERTWLDFGAGTSTEVAYRVAVRGLCGSTAWSDSAFGGLSPTAIDPPSGIEFETLPCGTLISWNAVPDAVGYQVFRNGWIVASVPADTLQYYHRYVSGASRVYQVRVIGECDASAMSPGAEAPLHPVFQVTPSDDACDRVIVDWELAGEQPATFTVLRDDLEVAVVDGSETVYEDYDVDFGREYLYRTVANFDCGDRRTPSRHGRAYGSPQKPQSFEAIPGRCRDVALSWLPGGDNVTSTLIFRDGEFVAEVDDTTWVDGEREFGVPYTYQIAAKNLCGTTPSDASTAVVPVVVPTVIGPEDGICVDGSVTYEWEPLGGVPQIYAVKQRLLRGREVSDWVRGTSYTVDLDRSDPPVEWSVGFVVPPCEGHEEPEPRFHYVPSRMSPASMEVTRIEDATWRFAWHAVPYISVYELAVADECLDGGESLRLYRVAGEDTTLTLPGYGGPGDVFHAWVTSVVCGGPQQPSECAQGDTPLPVLLDVFELSRTPTGVLATWRTGLETDIVGFHLYRVGANGLRHRVTASPVPPGQPAYRVEDRDVENGETYRYLLASIELDDEYVIAEREYTVPVVFSRLGLRAAPNPFNPRVTLHVELPVASDVIVDVLDSMGRRVHRVSLDNQNPGEVAVVWDGRDVSGSAVASGVYFARLRTAVGQRVVRLHLVR